MSLKVPIINENFPDNGGSGNNVAFGRVGLTQRDKQENKPCAEFFPIH